MTSRYSCSMLILTCVLLAACNNQQEKPVPVEEVETPSNTASIPQVSGTPLEGTKVRTDGIYAAKNGGLNYYMRFYPKGNVIILGGPEKADAQLKGLLNETAALDQETVYNVPVRLRGDSLQIMTKSFKGEIEYNALLSTGDSIQFLKHSHINGRSGTFTYHFQAN